MRKTSQLELLQHGKNEKSYVLCDRRMPVAIKGKVYRTMVRPILIYGLETWTLIRRKEERLEKTEMRMLRWILCITLRDKKRNDDIRSILGVACITDKLREARLRWFGHVQRREKEDCVSQENLGGRRTWTTE